MAGDPTGRISHLPQFHRGVSWKQPCRVATTANITIATDLNAGDTIDGVVLVAGDRVLVKDQTAGAGNGIYYAGVTPARDFDMDQDSTTSVTASEVMGAMVYIIAGTLNAGKLYRNTNTTAPTLGTTALTFAESASTLTVSDEGVALATSATTLDFVGAGVVASGTGATKTITIAGSGTLLSSIAAASAAIANTETVVVSASISANTLAVGQSFRIMAAGVGTTGLAPGNDTFRIRIGTTTLTGNIPTSVAAAANASVTAQPFSFEALVTIRTITASGTVIGECKVEGNNVATGLFTLLQELSATTATVVVDSTATKLLELTFQSGTAGSSCTFHVATIESLTVVSTGSSSVLTYIYQDVTTKTCSASTELFTTGSVTWPSGTYVLMSGWFVNTTGLGRVGLRVDGSDYAPSSIQTQRDARTAVGFQSQDTFWVSDGSAHTISIYFAWESGTAVFGLAGDARWARNLVMMRLGS